MTAEDYKCSSNTPIIQIECLSLSYKTGDTSLSALVDINLEIKAGEIFGLAGESGSGKTTLAMQLLGFRDVGVADLKGSVFFNGENLTTLRRRQLENVRGRRISYVPQNPTTALNPSRRVGQSLVEMLLVHRKCSTRSQALYSAISLFDSVGLPDPTSIGRRYPHQLSGGQQQRVTIAMALSCRPDLVVLDEPTTGLDVTTQRQIVELLTSLRAEFGVSMVYVTHDLGVLEEIADRVGIMYAGRIVEIGPTTQIFSNPIHPYTRGLIASVPRLGERLESGHMLHGLLRRESLPPGCAFQPRCRNASPVCAEKIQQLLKVDEYRKVACSEWRRIVTNDIVPTSSVASAPKFEYQSNPPILQIKNLNLAYGPRKPFLNLNLSRTTQVVESLSFEIKPGEVLALVGESGSGKSTIARAISGLLEPLSGKVVFDGETLEYPISKRNPKTRRRIQFIFQNPDASLNPRRTIGDSLERPLQQFFNLRGREARKRIERALDDVKLPVSYMKRYPDELSGGERQRVAIARAMLAEPELLLCDEILSALDVSVQANILESLKELRERTGIAMLFISHDLAVVEQIADRIAVLYGGQILEIGEASAVFSPPYQPYTRSLIAAVPGSAIVFSERVQQVIYANAQGCPFAGRCADEISNVCRQTMPSWSNLKMKKKLRCHHSWHDLKALAHVSEMPATEVESANDQS